MYKSRNKTDLIIEVWEKLDCESVGAKEITEIENTLRGRFGKSTVDSPMVIARMLADEGAELRHPEIMQLYVERKSNLPYEVEFRGILNFSSFEKALASIRSLENLRRKFLNDSDKEGVRILREKARKAKDDVLAAAKDRRSSQADRQQQAEIVEWLTLWLQSPELFESWIALRLKSQNFREKFGSAFGN